MQEDSGIAKGGQTDQLTASILQLNRLCRGCGAVVEGILGYTRTAHIFSKAICGVNLVDVA